MYETEKQEKSELSNEIGKTQESTDKTVELETEKNEIISKIKDLEKNYSSGDLLDEEYEEVRKQLVDKVKKLDEELKRFSGKESEDITPIRSSIEIEGKRTLDKVIEQVIPKDRTNNAIRLMFNLIMWGAFIIMISANIYQNSFVVAIIVLITLFILISGFNNLITTVEVSYRGIKYYSLTEKIDCDWKDILKIEAIEHKQRSEQTGLIVSSTTEYIIHTSEETFTLKEDNAWGRDALTLKNAYDKISSYAPHAEIIQREEESIISEGGGK